MHTTKWEIYSLQQAQSAILKEISCAYLFQQPRWFYVADCALYLPSARSGMDQEVFTRSQMTSRLGILKKFYELRLVEAVYADDRAAQDRAARALSQLPGCERVVWDLLHHDYQLHHFLADNIGDVFSMAERVSRANQENVRFTVIPPIAVGCFAKSYKQPTKGILWSMTPGQRAREEQARFEDLSRMLPMLPETV